jgi:hypothetical protein
LSPSQILPLIPLLSLLSLLSLMPMRLVRCLLGELDAAGHTDALEGDDTYACQEGFKIKFHGD